MTTTVDHLLRDHVRYHTRLQIDRFILVANSGGTHYGAYRQALREVSNRHHGLRFLEAEMEELRLQVLDLRPRFWWTRRRRATAGVQRRKLELRLDRMESKHSGMSEELAHFVTRARYLKSHVGDLTAERRQQLDLEFWMNSLLRRAAIEFQVEGNVSIGTMRTIAAMPPRAREILMDVIHRSRASADLRTWLMQEEQPVETYDVTDPADSIRRALEQAHSQADPPVADSAHGQCAVQVH